MSNTAKRKKRSSSLKGSLNPSKRHRDRFNIELDNLAKLLPFPHDVIQKLDKLSILRLSASYLRAKNFFKEQHWSEEHLEKKSIKATGELPVEGNGNFSKLLLEALDGFVVVLTQDFELFYASETIQQYLGLSQASVIHQDFLRFIHVDDHEMIKKYLLPYHSDQPEPKIKILDDENDGPSADDKANEDATSVSSESSKDLNTERNFVCRMKCILNTSAGFFKPFRCTGRLREMTLPDSDKQEYGLFLICTPMETMNNSILEIRLKTSLFCSKNRMDLSFMDIDQKGRSLLGYHKRDIALQSSYCMIHFDDIPILKQLHTDLMASGKCQGTFRLLNKNMKWQWLTGTAQVVFKGNEPDFIITTNRPLSEEEGEEVLRQRGQFPALPFTTPSDSKQQAFFMENPQEHDFKMPGGPAPKFPNSSSYGKRKRSDNYPEVNQMGPNMRGATPGQQGSLSPQPNGSPFPEDSFSSTACTSAPFSLKDLELGVDLQEELSKDAPELMLLSQDFPGDFNAFADFGRDTSLANHMGSLAMDEVPVLEDLPTLEDAMALVQECLSTPTESTASQLSSPCGSQGSYPQSPPHVQCDPFSPTSSVGHPSPFASPMGSQMGPPSVSPSGMPTPDPSPLGRREGDPARINISWQGPGHMKMTNQVPPQPRGSHSPQHANPPHLNGGVLSKSALLATMKKQEQRPFPSCGSSVPQPQSVPMAWSPQPPPVNTGGMQQGPYNWTNTSYHGTNNVRQGGRGLQSSRDPHWGQANQGGVSVPPLFEDTLRNLDYPEATSMISPPYQDDHPMPGYRFQAGQTPVTSAPYSKLEGW